MIFSLFFVLGCVVVFFLWDILSKSRTNQKAMEEFDGWQYANHSNNTTRRVSERIFSRKPRNVPQQPGEDSVGTMDDPNRDLELGVKKGASDISDDPPLCVLSPRPTEEAREKRKVFSGGKWRDV